MVVTQQKTEVLCIGKDRPSDTIDLNVNVLNFADEIKALGIYINGLNRSKAELTETCKRVTPEEWAKFATASKVTKIMRDEQPKLFCKEHILLNREGVVLENSLIDLKQPKGIRPCKTDWRA